MDATCDLHEPATQRFHPFHSQLYLGDGRAVYCGPLQHLEAHVYGAPVLHVGIYKPFKMMLADGVWRSYRVAVVPPGLRHALDVAGGVHGKLFMDVESPSASAFRRRFPYKKGLVETFRDPEIVACFHWIFEENPRQPEVESRLDGLLPAEDGATVDPRSRRSSRSSATSPTGITRKASSAKRWGCRRRASCISSAVRSVCRTGAIACGSASGLPPGSCMRTTT